jgi:hypothetical protein
MDFTKMGRGVTMAGHRPTHWGAGSRRSEFVFFPTKGVYYRQNTLQFHQLSGCLVSDDPAGEEARCKGPGLTWLHVVYSCEASWTYCQIL